MTTRSTNLHYITLHYITLHTCFRLLSRSWFSFTDPGGMEGWVNRLPRTATWQLSQLLDVQTVTPHWATGVKGLSVELTTYRATSRDARNCVTDSAVYIYAFQRCLFPTSASPTWVAVWSTSPGTGQTEWRPMISLVSLLPLTIVHTVAVLCNFRLTSTPFVALIGFVERQSRRANKIICSYMTLQAE